MRQGKKAPKDDGGLRRKAEQRVSRKLKKEPPKRPSDADALIQELQVHQIELEMQNENLRSIREEMEESRARYVDLYDFAPVGYLTLDNQGIVSEVNLTAAGLLGVERKFLVGKPLSLFVRPGFQDVFYLHRQKTLISEEKQTCEVALKRKDETVFNAQLESIAVEVQGRRVARTILTDITERKQAEEALQQERDLLQTVMNGARNSHLAYLDRDFNYVRVNAAYAAARGFSPGEMVGRNHFALYPDEEKEAIFARARDAGVILEARDEPYVLSTRSERGVTYWDRTLTPVKDKEDRVAGLVLSLFETTAHKLAVEAIKTSLREKETLLKEIHHRVKNNLQVMSSLFNLQAQYLTDPKALEAIRVSMDRIRTMALIHDKLYRSESLSRIHFPSYLGDLARDLISAYSAGKAIVLNLDVDPISLDIDTAIPLGLIVNELVSNSLKHGFPGEEGGMITVGLYAEDGGLTLVVSDTGAGFPEDIQFMETESMGMQLAVMLVEQLEGSIELKRGKGTEFRITFRRAE